MDYPENSRHQQNFPAWMQVARSEFELRAEVTFWRELIRDSAGAVPAASLERMEQALALAESRLRVLYTGYAGEVR